MKCAMLCFVLIGVWSGIPLLLGDTFEYECDILQRLEYLENKDKEKTQLIVSLEQKVNASDEVNAAQESKVNETQQLIVSLEQQVNAADEVNAALESKVNEQAHLLEGLTTKVATLEDLNSNLTGQLQDKLPKPAVVFYTRYPKTTSPGPNTLLIFNSTLVNTNTVYSTSTGYFTAPTAGVYLFAVQICGRQNRTINFRIYVNDDFISDTTQYDPDSFNHCTSTNAVAVLDAGDTVCVKTGPNNSGGDTLLTDTYRWSTFMGTLVHG